MPSTAPGDTLPILVVQVEVIIRIVLARSQTGQRLALIATETTSLSLVQRKKIQIADVCAVCVAGSAWGSGACPCAAVWGRLQEGCLTAFTLQVRKQAGGR